MGYIPHNVVLDRDWVVRYTNYGYEPTPIMNLMNLYAAESYCDNVTLSSQFMQPGVDSLVINAEMVNPLNHNCNVSAVVSGMNSATTVTVPLYDDGQHSDGAADDGIMGGFIEPIANGDIFSVRMKTENLTDGSTCFYNDAARFTTNGPLVYESFNISNIVNNIIFMKLSLRNDGSSTVPNVRAEISSQDPAVTNIVGNNQTFGDIGAGQVSESSGMYFIYVTDVSQLTSLNLDIAISSDGFNFWNDNTDMPLGIEPVAGEIPHQFALNQNYPNPFNPETTIEFSLPKSERVNLSVFNQNGELVSTLVSEELQAGNYKYRWNARELASGIYYYSISAGRFRQTRKLVLMK